MWYVTLASDILQGMLLIEDKMMRDFKAAHDLVKNSFYCSLSNVNDEGTPHTSPIGSVYLINEHEGYFIEMFTTSFKDKAGKKASIMAVNTSLTYWLIPPIKGRFKTPPATRKSATKGERRKITEVERARFHKRVRPFKGLKGHTKMWSKASFVRPFTIDEIKPVSIGGMTKALEQ